MMILLSIVRSIFLRIPVVHPHGSKCLKVLTVDDWAVSSLAVRGDVILVGHGDEGRN